MEEPLSRESEGDLRPFRPSMASPEKERSKSDKNRAREKTHFRLPSMVMKDELPLPVEAAPLFDPVARSLHLNDRKTTGKQFAFYNTVSTRKLINGKWIIFLGDSVVRAMYKDLIHMINNASSLVYPYDLARKGEISFENDQLLHGHKLFNREAENGINYEEVRTFLPRFQDCRGMISFCFVTKFWNENLRRTLESEFFHPEQQFGNPDVVFANSCLWDLARYKGYRSEDEMLSRYRDTVEEFVDEFKKLSNNKTLLVIMSTLPVSTHCSGAFLIDDYNSGMKTDLWRHIQKANAVCSEVVKKKAGRGHFVVYLDLYTLIKNLDLSPWMENDGTHWKPPAHRIFSYAILSFMQQTCYGSSLPVDSFDPYLRACDDLFRFNEYRRWLVMRILKKSKRSLEEVVRGVEDRRSKQEVDLEMAPYSHRYSHTNGYGGIGTPKQILSHPSAFLPEPSFPYVHQPVYPFIPDPSLHQYIPPLLPCLPVQTHFQRVASGYTGSVEMSQPVQPLRGRMDNIENGGTRNGEKTHRRGSAEMPSSSKRQKTDNGDLTLRRESKKKAIKFAYKPKPLEPKPVEPPLQEEYNPEFCIHDDDDDIPAGADAEQFYTDMYTPRESGLAIEAVRHTNNITIEPTMPSGKRDQGGTEAETTETVNGLLPTPGLLRTPGLLPEPSASKVPLPQISTLATPDSFRESSKNINPAPKLMRPVPPTRVAVPPPPPRVSKKPPPPPPRLPQPPPPPMPSHRQDFASDNYEQPMNSDHQAVIYPQGESAVSTGWSSYPTFQPDYVPLPPGQMDYASDEGMDWQYQ